MIYYLPIEPLEQRYTKQWYEWFPDEFRRQGKEFTEIPGEGLLHDSIEVGTFLDINSTVYWKTTQVQKVANLFHTGLVSDGDVFFLPDAEMFGLEATIAYLAKLNSKRVRIYGFAHAGSYTCEDFVSVCQPFAKHYEKAWGTIYEEIFVGSEYHKEKLCRLRLIHPERVKVTGNPCRVDEVRESIPWEPKRNRLILTNRPDPEKRPTQTLALFVKLWQLHPDWEFMVTTSRPTWGAGEVRQWALHLQEQGILQVCEGLSKEEYFHLLQTSRVMTSNTIEENFGYCVLEALIFGTTPVVPCGYSHSELLGGDPQMLFNSEADQIRLIEFHMDDVFEEDKKDQYLYQLAKKYDDSLQRIVERLV